MSTSLCKRCRLPVTWAEQKHIYGKLKRSGYSDELIKACAPRCPKCATKWRHEYPPGTQIVPTVDSGAECLD